MAIEKCIRENIKISDYLRRKTMEVRDMFSVDMFSLEKHLTKKDFLTNPHKNHKRMR